MIETENQSGHDAELDTNRELKSNPATPENEKSDVATSVGAKTTTHPEKTIPTLTEPTPDNYSDDTDILDVPILTDEIEQETGDILDVPILTDKIDQDAEDILDVPILTDKIEKRSPD